MITRLRYPGDESDWTKRLVRRIAYYELYEATPVWQVDKKKRRHAKWLREVAAMDEIVSDMEAVSKYDHEM